MNNINFSSPYLMYNNSKSDNFYFYVIMEKCINYSIENFIYGNEVVQMKNKWQFFVVYLLLLIYK